MVTMLKIGKAKGNRQRVLLLSVLVLFIVFKAEAQTTWVGGTAGATTAWLTATNWSTGVVPSATTDVIINSGTTYMPTISATGTYTVKSLTVNSGATLTITTRTLTAGGVSGSGSIIDNGILIVGDATNNSTSQFDGIISGTGVLTKAGTGSFTITGTNTYSGATNVNAGTIIVGNNAALGSTTATTIA